MEIIAGSFSTHDMALQSSQYYTTDDRAATISATKELELLYCQLESAVRQTAKPIPPNCQTRAAQTSCIDMSSKQALKAMGRRKGWGDGIHYTNQETRPSTMCL